MFKFCPRCRRKIRKRRDRYECASCGFCLFVNPPAAVAAIIYDNQRQVLLTRRARSPRRGYWELPGGFVNTGESAEEALRREVREELGIYLKSSRYLCSRPNVYRYRKMTYRPLDLFFTAPLPPAANIAPDQSEVSRWRLFPPPEVPWSNIAFKSYRPVLRRWFQPS